MTLRERRTAIVVLLCSLALPAWGQQYYLYEPKPTVPDAKEQTKDGILVKEVPILQGDTLYDISRKFSGHGMYYPQILLFNEIKNPNLIYTGDTLKIPLSRAETAEVPVSTGRPHAKAQKHSVKTKKKSSVKAARRTSGKQLHPAVVKKAGEISAELPLIELKKVESGKKQRRTKNGKTAGKVDKKAVADQIPALDQPKADTILQKKVDVVAPRPVTTSAGQQLFEKAVKAYRQDDCRTALELFDRYLADNPGSPMAADASLYKADCYLKLSAQ